MVIPFHANPTTIKTNQNKVNKWTCDGWMWNKRDDSMDENKHKQIQLNSANRTEDQVNNNVLSKLKPTNNPSIIVPISYI